ncbi:MAG: nickel insertion protein, partial [Candidatus Micrarchaeia archaeon]
MAQFFFIPEMGCSGDMVLSALADLGAESEIRESVRISLGVNISFDETFKNGVRAKLLRINSDERCSPMKMVELIRSAGDILELDDEQMKFAWDTFETIIEAERAIHKHDEVHLHEIGCIDTVVDIIGATVGFSALGAFESTVLSTPVAVGKKPAPASLMILKSRNFDFYTKDLPHELCTPTGASLLVNIAKRVEKLEGMGSYREGC